MPSAHFIRTYNESNSGAGSNVFVQLYQITTLHFTPLLFAVLLLFCEIFLFNLNP